MGPLLVNSDKQSVAIFPFKIALVILVLITKIVSDCFLKLFFSQGSVVPDHFSCQCCHDTARLYHFAIFAFQNRNGTLVKNFEPIGLLVVVYLCVLKIHLCQCKCVPQPC